MTIGLYPRIFTEPSQLDRLCTHSRPGTLHRHYNDALISPPSGRVALIVDDDADTRRLHAEYLHLVGFDVDTAEEGREALAKALTHNYDVIIMDARLRGIDGYQLVQLLRSDPATHDVPVIVVTGEGTSRAVDRAKAAGANAVFVKPALPDAILSEVRRLLEAPPIAAPLAADAPDAPDRARRRRSRSHAHQRGVTVAPPIQPPELLCPGCDKPLVYQRSYIGGVSANHAEQWDHYDCANGCGSFLYRQRTRKLRRA